MCLTRYTPVCTRAGHKQMSIAEQGSLCVHKRTDTGDEAGGRSGPCCGISLAGWGTSWSLLDFFFFFWVGFFCSGSDIFGEELISRLT